MTYRKGEEISKELGVFFPKPPIIELFKIFES